MPRRRGAIITIGDEVLNGSTLDTNSHWLCTQIAGRGALVTTVVTVHDDPTAIQDALAYCMRTEPDLIFTIGGLGPTIDDRTVESVAAPSSCRLVPLTGAVPIYNQGRWWLSEMCLRQA